MCIYQGKKANHNCHSAHKVQNRSHFRLLSSFLHMTIYIIYIILYFPEHEIGLQISTKCKCITCTEGNDMLWALMLSCCIAAHLPVNKGQFSPIKCDHLQSPAWSVYWLHFNPTHQFLKLITQYVVTWDRDADHTHQAWHNERMTKQKPFVAGKGKTVQNIWKRGLNKTQCQYRKWKHLSVDPPRPTLHFSSQWPWPLTYQFIQWPILSNN